MIRNRYRIIVCCVFCLFLTNTLTSQLHVGLQSGLLFSRAGIISKNKDLVTPTLNYIMTNATNLHVSYTLSPSFTLAVEPGYMQKSNEQNGGLTYIQLPVLAEYTLIDRLRLTAGPELNFLLNNDSEKKLQRIGCCRTAGCILRSVQHLRSGLQVQPLHRTVPET